MITFSFYLQERAIYNKIEIWPFHYSVWLKKSTHFRHLGVSYWVVLRQNYHVIKNKCDSNPNKSKKLV